MTTSGTYTFSLTKTNIISRAFQYLNIYDLADTVSSNDVSFASDMLNLAIKQLEAEGIKLWKRRQGYIFPALSTYKYDLGSVSGAEHCTNSYLNTTVSSASSTTIVVTSSTGMANSDNIGIQLDDGSRFWTTITNIASTTLTINTAIPSAASSGNTVITYTSKLNRPLQIVNAVSIDIENNNSTITIGESSHDNFFKIPLKGTSGPQPSIYFYDRLIEGALSHTAPFYVFPTPDNVNRIIGIRYYDSIQDMINTSDDPDFPQEWTLLLVLATCELLCVPYGRMQELPTIQQQLMNSKNVMDYFDSDTESLKFKPKK